MRTAASMLVLLIAGMAGGTLPTHASAIEAVLAASWEPAFCRTSSGRSKPECKSLTADRYDATHLSLHGLWPDDLDNKAIFPCYCGGGAPVSCETNGPVDRNLQISDPVMDRLRVVMPGTMSRLERHEWSKHGTCYLDGSSEAADPDAFFSDAIALVEKLDSSAVGQLLRGNIGKAVTRDAVEAAFDEAFGEGASKRVTIACGGRGKDARIAELRVNLSGDITPEADLGALILAAPTTRDSSDSRSCGKGLVVGVSE